MQVNGIGTGHGSEHQVTNCLHTHTGEKKGAAAMSVQSQGKLQQGAQTVTVQPEGFSLAAWMKNVLGTGRRLLLNIWGGGDQGTLPASGEGAGEASGEEGARADVYTDQATAQERVSSTLHTSQVAAASSLVQPAQSLLQHNPYFSAIEDTGKQKLTLWQKVRIRFQTLTSHMTKDFSGKNSFQAKQEQPKEDLRRHSRFRQDDLEVDCVLTDDSYLLDSYDRKGKYSRLLQQKPVSAGKAVSEERTGKVREESSGEAKGH